jgi:aryl-alcohol dehydrogenase-like predicted oxidoreductase
LVDAVQAFAAKKHATAAQIALAWVLAQKPWIVPIPGTTRLGRLEENIAATSVELTPEELHELEGILAKIPVVGDRYPAEVERMTNR